MINALTQKQSKYAEEHHNLIYAFLHMRQLSVDEYYDVVVFGYLKAVATYLTDAKLRERYKFSTIAFMDMKEALFDEYIKRNRMKRRGVTVSLDAILSADVETLNLGDSLYSRNPVMEALETEEILHEMSEWLTPQEMKVIHLRVDGYSPREISHELKMPPTSVHNLVHSARNTVYAVCA
jgi:RNA polymerase sigma-70 factor (ECF subfamily)